MAKRRQGRTEERARTPRLGLLTVGETSRILGVSPSTLRLWENVGLISPARSNGRYRLYGRELLEVLKRIRYLRDVKRLNLPGIRQELSGGSQAQAKTAQRQARGDDPRRGAANLGPKLRQLRRRHGIGVVEAARQLESQLWTIPPGTGSDGAYSHQGEEFIFMLQGTLELWLDELECHTLHGGDSFWFESTVGHRWFNPSDEQTILLWIITPPTF